MRRRRIVLIGGLAVLLIASAAAATYAYTRPAPEPPPTCGTTTSGPGPGTGDPRPLECFFQAFLEGRKATVRTVRYTVEGDPVTYRAKITLPGKRIELSIDSKDRFGPHGQFRYVCEGIEREPLSAGYTYVLTLCWDDRGGFISRGRVTI
jgi:hypothetical protein